MEKKKEEKEESKKEKLNESCKSLSTVINSVVFKDIHNTVKIFMTRISE